MKRRYPFDPNLKHHLLLAFGLAIWVFVFLFFTEPLDVAELTREEKLMYLPLYGLFASICYLISLPFQSWLVRKSKHVWTLRNELLQLSALILLSFTATRAIYYYIVVSQHPNAYTISYFAVAIFAPALLTVLPVILIGRWSLGKYKEKKLEDEKVEVKGQGNYEGLRLFKKDLIVVQSADNYIEVTYLSNGELKKQLIRTKLSDVEDQLPLLVRTHRSYLINAMHFSQWKSGNRKLFVVLNDGIEVPVSKTYREGIEKAVNSTTGM